MIYFTNLFTDIKELLSKNKKIIPITLILVLFFRILAKFIQKYIESENTETLIATPIFALIVFIITVMLRRWLYKKYVSVNIKSLFIEFFQCSLLFILISFVWILVLVTGIATIKHNELIKDLFILDNFYVSSFFLFSTIHLIGVVLVDFFLEKRKKLWSFLKICRNIYANKFRSLFHIFFLSVAVWFIFIFAYNWPVFWHFNLPYIIEYSIGILNFGILLLFVLSAQLVFVNRLRK